MKPAIYTEKLTKYYGDKRGIEDVDLRVEPGEVFAFLGPNGAGKSTAIRTILDFLHPTSGRAQVLGLDSRKDSVKVRRKVGYLPGEPALEERLTGRQLLAFFGNLRGGVDGGFVDELVGHLRVELDRPIRTLSRGNKQKIGIVQAFMSRPPLLILDEPTSGLDPLMQEEFGALVQEAKERGQAVFLSSHVMSEVEDLADRVGIIRAGRVVEIAAMSELMSRSVRRLVIRLAGAAPDDALAGVPGVRDRVIDGRDIRCTTEGAMDPVIKALAALEVVSMTCERPPLSEIFRAYYGDGEIGDVAGTAAGERGGGDAA